MGSSSTGEEAVAANAKDDSRNEEVNQREAAPLWNRHKKVCARGVCLQGRVPEFDFLLDNTVSATRTYCSCL